MAKIQSEMRRCRQVELERNKLVGDGGAPSGRPANELVTDVDVTNRSSKLMPDFQSSVSVPVSRFRCCCRSRCRFRKLRCRFRAVYGSRIRNDGNHFTFQCSELTDNVRQVRLSVCGILLLFACNVWQPMGNCILY